VAEVVYAHICSFFSSLLEPDFQEVDRQAKASAEHDRQFRKVRHNGHRNPDFADRQSSLAFSKEMNLQMRFRASTEAPKFS
jgi:hypothetical protein